MLRDDGVVELGRIGHSETLGLDEERRSGLIAPFSESSTAAAPLAPLM
jgi:hypothetical protein